MKNKEQGFTYPLTLGLLLIFLLFFSMHIEQFLTESKVAHEKAVMLQEEYYFLSSIKKLELLLQTGEAFPPKGTMTYKNGSMEYQAKTPSGYIQEVNFTLRLNSGDSMIGSGYFDLQLKKLIKWVE